MPTYDYHCPANDQCLTVYHGVHVTLADWGSLCAMARVPLGATPPETPVERQMGGGVWLRPGRGPHGGGACCGRGHCA